MLCIASPQDGLTPLGWASFSGYVEVVKVLLSAGAYKETADKANIYIIIIIIIIKIVSSFLCSTQPPLFGGGG